MKNGDKYININSNIEFTLVQETPITWSLHRKEKRKDYPIYPESNMKALLDKNFRKVE